jgi:hypothetical protein
VSNVCSPRVEHIARITAGSGRLNGQPPKQTTEESIDRVGDIDITQDLKFQKRSWIFQRVGWAAMALIVAIAAAGFLGKGPQSQGLVSSSDGAYEVEYPRYARHHSPEVIVITIADGAVEGDKVRLSLPQSYLEGLEVDSVFPEPDRVEVMNDEIVYVFNLGESAASAKVTFRVQYEDIGRTHVQMQLDGHPPVSVSQFIYP